MEVNILGIESSCDDTSAAVVSGGVLLSNVIASQAVHSAYGGVVPELASRAHQQNIIPVVDQALKQAGLTASDISAVAFTRGPGLLGSLIVGCSFAKGFALAGGIPMIEVNHLQGHVLSQFVHEKDKPKEDPQFPFLTLLVSGGHTQIIKVKDYFDMEIIGNTIDDAAGEAFDKCAKVMALGYPGGPVIDKHAHQGNPNAYKFAKPNIPGLDFSFSGLKTSFLYTLRDKMKEEPDFIDAHLDDLCASLQYTIVSILIDKLAKAVKETGIREITIGGGVAANSELRDTLVATAKKRGWKVFIPERKFTTDNAAMIAGAGYYKYLKGEFAAMDLAPDARLKF
ncbi:MAG: tRNA (adenosine(37)-N6)-threonylcarbamoyltransferase complex transferase subunit TsaD [Bacteroidales bacterium]|nr:tRNA (adenosine(37)-N6)-threonylcarbamoyltransferase complex transferase subunit TsaD [Bacteroidales bacterium]